MGRKLKLSWIASLKQWKKVYKGKQHWLGTGNGKDDMQSYKLALEEFERRKVKIDAEARAANQTNPYAPWQNALASREGVEPGTYLISPKAVPDSPQSVRNRETIGIPAFCHLSPMALLRSQRNKAKRLPNQSRHTSPIKSSVI